MNRKEALEALDELTQSNVFRTKQYPILEALINHHFDMVERVEKVQELIKPIKELYDKYYDEDMGLCPMRDAADEISHFDVLAIIKATEAL